MKTHLKRAFFVALLAALAACAAPSGGNAVCDPTHIQMELGNTAMNCKPA